MAPDRTDPAAVQPSTYATALSAACLLVAITALPIAARAEDEARSRTSSLSWVRLPGAESCVEARALAKAVEARLGRPAFVAPTQGDLTIEGRVEPAASPARWRATITVADDRGAALGTRDLTSDRADCRAFDEELALVIALLIDPNAALAPAAPAPPPPPPVVVAPAPPQVIVQREYVPIRVEVPAPRPREPFRVGAEAGGVCGFGLLPSPGAGVAIRVRLAPPPKWPSFELGSAIWFDNTAEAAPIAATFALAWGSLAVCPLNGSALGTSLSACLGAQVGSLRVGGFGFDLAYRQEQLVVDVASEARARRKIVGPLFVGAGLALIVPLVRDRFYYLDAQDGRRDVFQMTPVAGTLDATLGIELP